MSGRGSFVFFLLFWVSQMLSYKEEALVLWWEEVGWGQRVSGWLGWGANSHGVTGTGTPFLSSDGPSGWRSRCARRVLGVDWALVGSQAALKEGLGVLGCPHHRKPQAKVLGCYAGVSTRRIRRSEGCGVHARGCRDQLEVVLCLPCPGVTGTSSFMPRVS